ncbi:type IV secretion system DNA-binding domain-containing protein [Sphingosinicella microcystinivorans]|uniref:type IV secretion system DNA-binding domain-containing protein n=1 Tax=Sphingosinicella microcystinivorans TaxID=335406 RepID=UPI0022F3F886|nr:type IV secretion system DNA-binding domain-containing protein [Sphingosinicella microcystinivorans]WBX84437.1 type IV secretion system DNA-binding domain-containing protein [Sphingosinicella microcystinivorans]
MSIFRNDTLGSWTRGGQAIVHNVRMTTQVFFQTTLAGLAIWLIGAVWYAFEKSDEYQRFVLMKVVEATFKADAAPGTNAPVLFRTPVGKEYWTSADWLLESTVAREALKKLEGDLISGALIAGLFALGALILAWFYFTRTGKGLGSNEYLRGARFGTAGQVRRALWRERKGSFAIGGTNVPHAFEPEHVLICGAPGTGKTNMIVKMLAGIRKAGKRAIVYDTAGTFVEKFYRPGKDILLNPLDDRTAVWSPWVDVPRDYHYDQIAESTIPDKTGDPFWSKAARGTLVAVMRKLAAQGRTYVSILLRTVLRSTLKELSAFSAGTDAAAFISMEGERTSAGIQAELASVMRSFAYLDDTEDGLSIRDWVTTEGDDSWLFITVKADQLPSLRPLITVWLDIAISAIMSLTPDRERRLYCVVDELPSLQKLPSLSDFLARARKYGGCGILGFQSYPQLEATYGIQDAAAITGYCSTWVALRANDTPTAKHVSENLGQVEQVEANEGMSYGVNDMRDGVNLSRIQVTRPLVMHTEVTNLPNLSGYLRFGRDLPVIRFTDSYNRAQSIGATFIERTRPPLRVVTPQTPPSPPATPGAAPAAPAAASAAACGKPTARKRLQKKASDAGAPELPFDPPAPVVGDAEEGGGVNRAETPASDGADSPEVPAVPVEIIGRRWNQPLHQHGRPGGSRRPARPA